METGSSNGRRVRFGAFEADLQAGELRKSGIRVRLQDQPFRVLTLLLECSGEVVSREDLRQEIWPDDTFVDFDHSLNTAINKIREALGDSASHPRFVETIPRRGYRFVFPLDRPPPRESVSKVGGAALRDPAESNGPTVAQAGLLLRSLKGLLNSVPSTAWLILVAGISVLSLLLGLYIGRTGTASTEPPLRKLELSVNAGEALISPNGEMIAYLHRNRLWIRRLDETEPRELPETQGAQRLFWSPDSRFVGYLQDSVLRRISVDGGQSVEICELQLPAFGAIGLDVSWGPRGNLVFGGLLDRGLYEVPALGGSPRLLLAADRPREDHFDSPLFLEDGRTLLFGSLKVEGRYGGGANELFVLEDHVRRRVFQTVRHNIVDVCYSPSGHIIYQVRGQQIWAVPFSASSATVTGEPFLVATGRGPSVSNEGTLTYLRNVGSDSYELVLVDRKGKILARAGEPQRAIKYPAFSPDGRRIAISGGDGDNSDIWVHGLSRSVKFRLTFSVGREIYPTWSPKGDQLAFRSVADGNISVKSADGTGTIGVLVAGPPINSYPDWSRDGRYLAYAVIRGGHRDIWYVNLAESGKPEPFLQTPANEAYPRISPDGRFLAYVSNETGAYEVYVKPFPEGEGKWQVSRSGGQQPRWNPRGGELFYVELGKLMVAQVQAGPPFRVEGIEELFGEEGIQTRLQYEPGVNQAYDVAPNGEQFVVIRPVGGLQRSIMVVQNWLAEFKDQHGGAQ